MAQGFQVVDPADPLVDLTEMAEPSIKKEIHSEAMADSTPDLLKRKASQVCFS